MIKGIDVSNHQERVDWTRVKTDGVAFAYIKATEGIGYVDPKMGAFAAGAQEAGIRVGFYHFGYLLKRDESASTSQTNVWKLVLCREDSEDKEAFLRTGDSPP